MEINVPRQVGDVFYLVDTHSESVRKKVACPYCKEGEIKLRIKGETRRYKCVACHAYGHTFDDSETKKWFSVSGPYKITGITIVIGKNWSSDKLSTPENPSIEYRTDTSNVFQLREKDRVYATKEEALARKAELEKEEKKVKERAEFTEKDLIEEDDESNI